MSAITALSPPFSSSLACHGLLPLACSRLLIKLLLITRPAPPPFFAFCLRTLLFGRYLNAYNSRFQAKANSCTTRMVESGTIAPSNLHEPGQSELEHFRAKNAIFFNRTVSGFCSSRLANKTVYGNLGSSSTSGFLLRSA